MRISYLLILTAMWVGLNALQTESLYFSNPSRPMVIAHRGSCGDFPEHSAAAYTSAYFEGADFNEPDLQVTSDGVLLVMHSPCLKETTNIDSIPQFNHRKTNFTFAGRQAVFSCTDDYLVNDFSFKELIDAGVKLRNRLPKRNPHFNDIFPLMRLEDAIELMLDLNIKSPLKERVFRTGLYIETKHVQFYTSRNFNIASLLFDVLKKYDIETVDKATYKLPIIIESFEEESLLYFKDKTDLPRIQLLSPDFNYDLKWISKYAHGVGPKTKYLFNYKDEKFNLSDPSLFIKECHELNLLVHPWVFQDDDLQYTENSIDEFKVYLQKGVDGIFTEFPQSTYQTIKYFTK